MPHLAKRKSADLSFAMSCAALMRTITRVIVLAAGVIAVLAGCAVESTSQAPSPQQRDGAPNISYQRMRELARLSNPEVRSLPRSKTGNPSTYTVWGESYRVWPSAQGYKDVGLASWYGTKFHGRSTSSGEPFDMYQLTAAHRSLPIPVFAEVTNLENGRSTIVKINDRGPFHSDRIIDLSYAAAVKLNFHKKGTARVRVEVISADTPAKPLIADRSPTTQSRQFLVGGYFSVRQAALEMSAQIATMAAIPSSIVKSLDKSGYQVRVGPINSDKELQRIQGLMQALDLGAATIWRMDPSP